MKRSLIPPAAWVAALAVAIFAAIPAGRAAAGDLAPEYTEKLQRLSGLVEDLLASQASLQKRTAALADELQSVREEETKSSARLNERFATREELRRLAESVRELDRKREEDRRLILEEIRKLAHTPAVVPRETPRPPAKDPAPAVSGKGYTYTIKKDDTISAIVQAYRASGVNVSVDEVLKANPNVKPTALREGQEIFIPDPALK